MPSKSPNLLVFQHIAIEHPGSFRALIRASGTRYTTVELDEGERIPDLADFDGLWVMGGPMDVWQKDEHPWLEAEIEAIYDAVAVRNMPFMGLCLGHQLLAEALGGEVGVAATPEIGVLDVALTPEGEKHPLLQNVPAAIRTLQWHSAEVVRVPESAVTLMSTPACACEAMAVGDTALGMQFHVEIEPDTVRAWGDVPEYASALAASCGANALQALDQAATESIAGMQTVAKTIYSNWFEQSFG